MVGITPIRSVPVSGSPSARAASTRSSASSEHAPRPADQLPPRRGDEHAAAIALEQAHAERAPRAAASCALSEGCDTWHASAARRKLRASATATAYWS